jgi:hypothetical protein
MMPLASVSTAKLPTGLPPITTTQGFSWLFCYVLKWLTLCHIEGSLFWMCSPRPHGARGAKREF